MNKPFNPFKPHIVEFSNGMFAVRKFSFPFWHYYDNQKMKKDDYWWHGASETAAKYYQVDTLEMAQTLLEMCQLRKQINSKKIVRVIQ